MSLEIERRFVLDELPEAWRQQAKPIAIKQGYLIIEDKRELRLRKKGNRHLMTVKYGTGLMRDEQEEEINATLFDMLWPLTEGKRLEKTRYSMWVGDDLFEADVFEGDLAPLLMLEVEFATETDANNFTPPDFGCRDVTDDPRYKNASLATSGYPRDA